LHKLAVLFPFEAENPKFEELPPVDPPFGVGRRPCVTAPLEKSAVRIDQWLWAVRIFKTRGLAGSACRAGSVTISDQIAKPARNVQPGEQITVRQGLVLRTLRVVAVPRSRVGARLVPVYCTDLTPPGEFEKAKEHRVQQLLAREKGSGRPTKRDRRMQDRLFE
jgi:ribosome-associated heat shock protein Hsp15